MSSYLSIYLVPKKKEGQTIENKPLYLTSYSRSTHIYQYFYENLNVAYIGNDDEYQYTELNPDKINSYVIDEIKEDIAKAERRLNTYYKICSPEDRRETVEDIISCEEYITELKSALNDIYFIKSIVSDTVNGYNDFEKVLANID